MIHRYPDKESVARASADRISQVAMECLQDDRPFHLVLSGGSTPKVVFSHLIEMKSWNSEIQKNTHLWFGDERSVPNDHEDSNVLMAEQFLISKCRFPEENIHRINGGANNLDEEAKRYESEILANIEKGNGDLPVFDLVMLGMGDDGHTASLFPGTKALGEHKKLVVANEVPQKNTWRLTMTYPLLNAAHDTMIIVTGADKAPVLKEIFQDDIQKYPVEQIVGNGKNVRWFVDQAAMPESL